MNVGLIGINYKSADLRIREYLIKISINLLTNRKNYFSFPLVPLVTCNRIEFYFEHEYPEEAAKILYEVLFNGLEEWEMDFSSHVYFFFDRDCFIHLVKVTSGLDSILLGETEIQGQVKRAYQEAVCYGDLSCALHFLFQKSLKIGKDIRNTWGMLPGGSLESILFDTIMQLRSDTIKTDRILFIGFSKINRKIARFLLSKGLKLLTIYSNQRMLIEKESSVYGTLCSPETFDYSQHYKIIVCGTNSTNVNAIFSRLVRSKDTLVFDISVPRSIDSKFESEVQLFNMDFINHQSSLRSSGWEDTVVGEINNRIFLDVTLQLSLFQKKIGYHRNCFAPK